MPPHGKKRLSAWLFLIPISIVMLVWVSVVLHHTAKNDGSADKALIDGNALRSIGYTRQQNTLMDNTLREPPKDGYAAPDVILPRLETVVDPKYPYTEPLIDIVTRWNPDEPDAIPRPFFETLQVFNYSDPYERSLAEMYRDKELPFKVYDIPEMDEVVRKWTDEYLVRKLKPLTRAHVEESNSNHFMYWAYGQGKRPGSKYVPPTKTVSMNFEKWLKLAHAADETKLSNDSVHYYFQIGTSSPGQNSFVTQDLRHVFNPKKDTFFVTKVEANKGIQCRFGMRGIIAEAHYDSGRNMVGMFKGSKRYILAPPSECEKLGIISDRRHPSFRHSLNDWSNPQQVRDKGMADARAIDTVVRTGEFLYIPSFWFHYITSLGYSVQCNSRSGTPPKQEGQKEIEACLGFKLDFASYNKIEGKRGLKKRLP